MKSCSFKTTLNISYGGGALAEGYTGLQCSHHPELQGTRQGCKKYLLTKVYQGSERSLRAGLSNCIQTGLICFTSFHSGLTHYKLIFFCSKSSCNFLASHVFLVTLCSLIWALKKCTFFFFSAASLSLGTDQSNLHELHVLLFNFTIIIVSVIKIMPMWSDIFLIVFFLLISLFYSSSIYPFPYAFSYGRGEWTLPRSCGCGCTLPWPASMLATLPCH